MIDRIFNVSCPSKAPKAPARSQTRKAVDEGRPESLSLHVETGDYFLYLSTLFGFVEETLSSARPCPQLTSTELEAVRAAREDLQYLSSNYRIEPRR